MVPSILWEVSVVAVPHIGGIVLFGIDGDEEVLVCARNPWTEEMVGDAACYVKPEDQLILRRV